MTARLSPVPPSALAADHATVIALQTLFDYQPTNPACSIAQILQLQATLAQAEQAEVGLESALAEARSVRAATSHAYHDTIVSARTQVLAQYGPNSNAVAIIGLKRKSDRKRPTSKKAAAE